jgi:single-strand DNA-binding protein
VSVWKNFAENISESLHKGDKVTVSGRLAQSTYTKDDGTEHTKLAVEGAVVGVDLSRCKVTVSRIVRGNAAEDAFGASYNGEPEAIAVDEETGEIIAA